MTLSVGAPTASRRSVLETSGRIGLATRGAIYLVSALLTLRIAYGSSDEGPGASGAVRALAEQPFAQVLLIALVVGCGAYALWNLFEAATYRGGPDDGSLSVWGQRAAHLARAAMYGLVTLTTLALATVEAGSGDAGNAGGSGSGGSGGGNTTARVFDMPAGRWIVLGVGAALLTAAGVSLYRALTDDYDDHWRPGWDRDMSGSAKTAIRYAASAGLVGNVLMLGLLGVFLTESAITYDQSAPEGLDQAIRSLAGATAGTLWLTLFAAGMAAYAAFSFMESRWRDVLE